MSVKYRTVSEPGSGAVDGRRLAPLVREPLSGDAAAELAVSLKALADPIRLRLISLIAGHVGGEACVCEVSVGIELVQPTISQRCLATWSCSGCLSL